MNKKTVNKGIVLSEILCYICIFSFILSVIISCLFMIEEFNKKMKESYVDLSLEVQELIYQLDDTITEEQENLYVVFSKELLQLYGVKTNKLYLTISEEELNSNVLNMIINIEKLNLTYSVNNKFIVLTNEKKDLIYIIDLEWKI